MSTAVRVALHPSQRVFEQQPGESLLRAGLRAGVNLPYRCSNGTCGECRARLLEGTVQQMQHADYPLTAAERAQGTLLTCSHTATSPAILQIAELNQVSDVPHQTVSAKVVSLDRIADDYLVMHARTPRSRHLQFLAGQSVGVTLPDSSRRVLPLANCPCDGMRPQFHLRRIDGDEFTDHVFTTLNKSSSLQLDGPMGDFVLDESSDHSLLFVAYAHGFAPVYSLLEHAIALEWPASLRLVWLSDDGEFYLRNYCRATADALDEFDYDLIAQPDSHRLEKVLATLSGSFDVYAAVPDQIWSALQSAIKKVGLQTGRIQRESVGDA